MLTLVLLASSLVTADYAVLGALLAGGDQQMRAGQPEAALQTYRAAAALAPANGAIWGRLAIAYQRNGQPAESMQAAIQAGRLGHRGILAPVLSRIPIHMDCWGNGGPCPAGTLPNLGAATLSSPNVEELPRDMLRNAEITTGPAGDQRVEIRPRPAQQQR